MMTRPSLVKLRKRDTGGGWGLVSIEIQINIYISIYVSLYIVDLYIYIFMHLLERQRGGRTFVIAAPGPMCVCVCVCARACVCMTELAYQLRSEHHSSNCSRKTSNNKYTGCLLLHARSYISTHTYTHTGELHGQGYPKRVQKLHSTGSDKQGGLGHMNQHNSKSFTLRT
jgi:hypothetical protein